MLFLKNLDSNTVTRHKTKPAQTSSKMLNKFRPSIILNFISNVSECLLRRLITRHIYIGCLVLSSAYTYAAEKTPVKALYIPLADHYAALVALERYGPTMQHAEFSLEQMKNWDLLRAKFLDGQAQMAFVMSPLAMDMFNRQPNFRWVGLMHRDGNALAINHFVQEYVSLAREREQRKPTKNIAAGLKQASQHVGRPVEVGTPHLLSTHTVVLYKFLRDHKLQLTLTPNSPGDVLAIAVPPPKSPVFLLGQSNRANPAAFEQSLPWADIVESEGFGKVAWYSKDVLPSKHGHVECITLASDTVLEQSPIAVQEVIEAIQQAGRDIEAARKEGGEALNDIVAIIRHHIPSHTKAAIVKSLDPALRVINYEHLNVDPEGLRVIMDLALEGDILSAPIDIENFIGRRVIPLDSMAASP